MKRFYILYFILFFFTLPALAQQQQSQQNKIYKGDIRITPVTFEQRDDSLYVEVTFDFKDVVVASTRYITLSPVIVSLSRGVTRRLDGIQVRGRRDYLTFTREYALMSRVGLRDYEQKKPYIMLKGYGRDNSSTVSYRKTLKFEAWMKDARLDVVEETCDCGNAPVSAEELHLVSSLKLETPIAPYVVSPLLAYVKPKAEEIKRREMVNESFLDFAVSKSDIRPDYMNNPAELAKIRAMMEEVKNDPNVTVKSIAVVGYASPEGTLRLNQTLSENRAKSLVEYLTPRFTFPRDMYKVRFGGENWGGLKEVVEGSDMQYRDEVLTILAGVSSDINAPNIAIKQSLKTLKAGVPYRYMLKEYYPQLRKAICKIDYVVKVFDVDEAKIVVKTRPQNLSLNEMYLVANTYENGSEDFINLFETAVKMFPEDEVANLNASAAALSRGDIVSAERYLKKRRSQMPEYFNAEGVLLMLKGDYAGAEQSLQRAIDGGLSVAKHNMAELNKKKENVNQIKQQNKKFN